MDELKKTPEEENNTAVEQIGEVPAAVSDDDVDKVAAGYQKLGDDWPCNHM